MRSPTTAAGAARSCWATAADGYTATLGKDRISQLATTYKYVLLGLLLLVIFNLGQALYFMMTDKDDDRRTVWALTRRIGLSLLFIAMVIVGIWMGWLQPHDIGQ